MSRFKGLFAAAATAIMLASALPANAVDQQKCWELLGAYEAAYDDYVAYYQYLHGLYPNGDNPPDTALLIQQKIDAMYAAQDAFAKEGCGNVDYFRDPPKGKGGDAPPPGKIDLKHGS